MKKLFLAAFLFNACFAMAQTGTEFKSKHGYRMIVRTDMGQPKAQFMDEFVVHVGVFIGDTLMHTSQSQAPQGFQAPLPAEEEYNNSPSAPVLVDAALLMGAGDSLTAFMAIDSFIRATLPPELRKFNDVRYEIKMLKVISGHELRLAREKAMARFESVSKTVETMVAAYRSGALKVTTQLSGLKYHVVDEGDGMPVTVGQNVSVHYYGCLRNGTMFDNSFEHGEPLQFAAGTGQMIPGFDEGVLNLRHGAKAYLFLPPALGYGDRDNGAIPANSELVFYIEIQ